MVVCMTAYKDYLGDGVYADVDGDTIVLTTENGISVSNRIYLDADVLAAFERYVARMKEQFS